MPIGCFILFVVTYAVNVPWFDDIDAFLGFTLAYTDATTLSDKVYNVLVPNNEHRIVIAKLITLAMYYLTGEVNFRWLILIALLFILGTLGLLSRVFRSMQLPWLAFLPVPFLLLQPEYYLTSLWSIPGLQHSVVICLTLSSLYMLTQPGRSNFALAITLQILAALSMSNGLMGLIAGGIILALSRNWYRLGGWVVGSVIAIWLYFYNFQSAGRTSDSLAYSLAHPVQAFGAFFTFTGAMFDLTPTVQGSWRYAAPTLAGVVLAALVLSLVYRMGLGFWPAAHEKRNEERQKRRLFFIGGYVFLFGNVAIIALLRLRYGYEVMVVSNYMIYPAVMAALIYLNVLSESLNGRAQQQCLKVGALVSILIWVFAYGLYWPRAAYRKQMLLTSAMNQKHNDIGLGATWGTPFANMARSVMRESAKRGIYKYPTSYVTPVESLLTAATATPPKDSCLTMQVQGGGYSYVAQTDPMAYQNGLGQAAILVQSDKRLLLYASEIPFTLRNFWLNRPITSVKAEIINIMLEPGRYKVGVLTPSEPNRPIQFSCQTVTIP
ncbi:hypothetical protein GCM10028818_06430 [Spirosoma horti]